MYKWYILPIGRFYDKSIDVFAPIGLRFALSHSAMYLAVKNRLEAMNGRRAGVWGPVGFAGFFIPVPLEVKDHQKNGPFVDEMVPYKNLVVFSERPFIHLMVDLDPLAAVRISHGWFIPKLEVLGRWSHIVTYRLWVGWNKKNFHPWKLNGLLVFTSVKSRSTCSPLGGDCFGRFCWKKVSKEFSNIPQTFNHLFMKEFLLFEGLGMPGVCSRGMLGFS